MGGELEDGELEEGELEEGEFEMGEVGADAGFGGGGGGGGGGMGNNGGGKRARWGEEHGEGGWEGEEWGEGGEGGGGVFTASTPGHPHHPARQQHGHGGGRGGQWEPPPFNGNPAMSLPMTPPMSQYMGALAGWAGGRPAAPAPPPGGPPVPGSSGPGGGLGAMTPPFHSNAMLFNGGGGGPHTTGKDGRDGSKRQRTMPSVSAGSTGKPCLFWRQGSCKNGAECTYLHGDSPVPCTNFNSRMGCRFGDKCAFAHVPGGGGGGGGGGSGGGNFNAAAAVAGNPFSTHARNCGCPACKPYAPPKVTHVAAEAGEGEDGEMLEVVEEPLEGGWGELLDPAEVAARDAVLQACSVIESPGMVAAWRSFLSSVGVGRSNKLIPFWKQKQQLEQQQQRGGGVGGK
jgi:hypothetical protein